MTARQQVPTEEREHHRELAAGDGVYGQTLVGDEHVGQRECVEAAVELGCFLELGRDGALCFGELGVGW